MTTFVLRFQFPFGGRLVSAVTTTHFHLFDFMLFTAVLGKYWVILKMESIYM